MNCLPGALSVRGQRALRDKRTFDGWPRGADNGAKNPGKYTSVSAFAPIVDPTQVPWGQKAFRHYLGEDVEKWQEWDSCALMLASQSEDAIPMLVDQGDADQFLAGQLQPAVLAEAARQKDWPLTLRIQPGYDHSYYFMASFIEDHLRFHAEHLFR